MDIVTFSPLRSLTANFAIVVQFIINYILILSKAAKRCLLLLKHSTRSNIPVIAKLQRASVQSTVLADASANYEQIPDVCLFRIFNQLSTYDLLHAGAVCTRWRRLQKSAFLSRKSLTILIGDRPLKLLTTKSMLQITDNMEAYKQKIECSHVYLSRLGERTVRRLLTNFPNIEHLCISMHATSSKLTRKVAFLLSKWAHCLTSLQIHANFEARRCCQNAVISSRLFNLLEAINGLPNVKVLTLQLRNTFISYDHCKYVQSDRMQIDLPILARLHEFNFCSSDHATFLYESFLRYAVPNRELKSISMYNHIGRNTTWDKYLHLDPDLLKRFTQIRLHLGQDNIDTTYSKLMPLFTSVTNLRIYIEREMTYHDVIVNLSKMTQLTKLNIEINNDFILGVNVDALDTLPQLSSVKDLTLHTMVFAHEETHIPNFMIERVFPNLDLLNVPFDIFQCSTCGYYSDELEMRYGTDLTFLDSDSDDEDIEDIEEMDSGYTLLRDLTKKERVHCATALIKPLEHYTKFLTHITFEWPDSEDPLTYEEVLQ